MTERFRELLIEDAELRSAIIAKYEADKRASTDRTGVCDRLMLWPEDCALDARNQAARRTLPKNPAELSDKDLRILRPDELVKLVMTAGGEQTETIVRRVVKAAGNDGRSIVRKVFDSDSEDRAMSKKVVHVLTNMWSKEDEESAQQAADLFNGFGFEIDISSYQGQQWFQEAKAEVIRAAVAVCDLAQPKSGSKPFERKVNQAVNILSHLGDGSAIPTLQSLLAKLHQEIEAHGVAREHVNDGRVFGTRSNADSVSHIESAISKLAEKSKKETAK